MLPKSGIELTNTTFPNMRVKVTIHGREFPMTAASFSEAHRRAQDNRCAETLKMLKKCETEQERSRMFNLPAVREMLSCMDSVVEVKL